jgi:hypothetical protein
MRLRSRVAEHDQSGDEREQSEPWHERHPSQPTHLRAPPGLAHETSTNHGECDRRRRNDDETAQAMDIACEARWCRPDRHREPRCAIGRKRRCTDIRDANHNQPQAANVPTPRRRVVSDREEQSHRADPESHERKRHQPAIATTFVLTDQMSDVELSVEYVQEREYQDERRAQPSETRAGIDVLFVMVDQIGFSNKIRAQLKNIQSVCLVG